MEVTPEVFLFGPPLQAPGRSGGSSSWSSSGSLQRARRYFSNWSSPCSCCDSRSSNGTAMSADLSRAGFVSLCGYPRNFRRKMSVPGDGVRSAEEFSALGDEELGLFQLVGFPRRAIQQGGHNFEQVPSFTFARFPHFTASRRPGRAECGDFGAGTKTEKAKGAAFGHQENMRKGEVLPAKLRRHPAPHAISKHA